MQLNEIQYSDALPIEGYGADFFRIDGERITAPALIHAEGAQHWSGTDDVDTILAMAGQIDFILLGTGQDLVYAPKAFREALEAAGIGVEVMKTESACRTYNVLVSEGRRVVAALLPVAG